ncbi:MAG: hypothetical protein WBK75_04990 [Acutalibacteraceae bacterium]|jgi:hypothetical protein|nr:hypothetical protein [Clostridiales bacterium]
MNIDLNKIKISEHNDFEKVVKNAVLLSLLDSEKITKEQFDFCMNTINCAFSKDSKEAR